jgi:hypothetical protein
MNWLPHPFCRTKWLPTPLSERIARLQSLAGKGTGGPKSYDSSTETLVLSVLYSLYKALAKKINRRMISDIVKGKIIVFFLKICTD